MRKVQFSNSLIFRARARPRIGGEMWSRFFADKCRSAEPEDAMVIVRLLDEQQPDKYETI